eukprot:SM000227S07453  [mRNA]  locus=s227:188035:190519:+ [translate_table: standard]
MAVAPSTLSGGASAVTTPAPHHFLRCPSSSCRALTSAPTARWHPLLPVRSCACSAAAVWPSVTHRQPAIHAGKPEADVVVIGSGLGGLSCAALLARYGRDVIVCESHSIPGGAAHSFTRQGFHFDSGPSLFLGLASRGPQANPLAQVLDAVGEQVPCISYDSWMAYLPEGDFLTRIGPTHFLEVIAKALTSTSAVWAHAGCLQAAVEPLTKPSMALPPAALRADPAVAITVSRFAMSLLRTFAGAGPAAAMGASKLLGPFSDIVDSVGIKDAFMRNCIDLLAFLLSGLKADGTLAAEIVYMFGEWYKEGSTMDYPVGGTGAIVDALVRGFEKHGGRLALSSHVQSIVIENGRARGVRLRSGQVVRARKAVVSNASIWDTMRLLPPDIIPAAYKQSVESTPQCESLMHLHLGLDGKNLPADLGIHDIVVNDWTVGVNAPQNVVLISIPSVLDPFLAPPGKHVLHAYTPGTEPHELWEGLDRQSKEYKELKDARAEASSR